MAKVILDTDTGEMTDMFDKINQSSLINIGQDPEQFFGVWQNYAYNQMVQQVFQFWLSSWNDLFGE